MPINWLVIATALQVVQSVSSLHTDYVTRRTLVAQERASEASRPASENATRAEESRQRAAPVCRGEVFARTVEIPDNAFNAGAAFTSVFAATAIVGISLLAKTAVELRRMRIHIEEIRDELGAQTTAMVQGWQNEGFGDFIYRFLRTEIDDYGGEASVGHHAFYVYNPTTSADVVFKQKVRDQPLPPSFGGMSSDIEAIFRLMWANRQTLRATMPRDAADAVVFHLLVPAKRTMAILERMAIHDSIGKLIIKGHMDEGSCYVWFNFVQLPRQVTLHHIRNLDTDKAEDATTGKVAGWGVVGFLTSWTGAVASFAIFPPAAMAFVGGIWVSAGANMAAFGHGALSLAMRGTLRILGPPPDGGDGFFELGGIDQATERI